MKEHPTITEAEWDLVTELLHMEVDNLPDEIQHTHDFAYRSRLRDRLKAARHLLEKLGGPVAA